MTNELIVKQKYPDAQIERDGALFFCFSGKGESKKDLGAGFSKIAAWCSASNTISNEKRG